jgi:hypothetical protein
VRKETSQTSDEEFEPTADRRSSSAAARLCAGIFLLYQRQTGARQSDPFIRDAKTWSRFEQAALPEMGSFTFLDRKKNAMRTPNSVLADTMGHIWIAERLPNSATIPTTVQVVTELANRIAAQYEIRPVERRSRKRASLGLDVLA